MREAATTSTRPLEELNPQPLLGGELSLFRKGQVLWGKGEPREGLGSVGDSAAEEKAEMPSVGSNRNVEIGKGERKESGERSEPRSRVVKSLNTPVFHSRCFYNCSTPAARLEKSLLYSVNRGFGGLDDQGMTEASGCVGMVWKKDST